MAQAVANLKTLLLGGGVAGGVHGKHAVSKTAEGVSSSDQRCLLRFGMGFGGTAGEPDLPYLLETCKGSPGRATPHVAN